MNSYENPSSASRVFPSGQTEELSDCETDVSKLIAANRNFANAPKLTFFERYDVDSKIILK